MAQKQFLWTLLPRHTELAVPEGSKDTAGDKLRPTWGLLAATALDI